MDRGPATAVARTAVARTALALSGWLALAAATYLPGGSPLRWVPVLVFVCLCPGLALLRRLPEARALAAPFSLSLAALTATGLFLAGVFSTGAFLGVLALFTSVAAALPGRRPE